MFRERAVTREPPIRTAAADCKELAAINCERNDDKELLTSSPKSCSDALVVVRRLPCRRLFSSSVQEQFDFHSVLVSWTSTQFNHMEPLEDFPDIMLSIPKFGPENVTSRIHHNTDLYLTNDDVSFNVIFAGHIRRKSGMPKETCAIPLLTRHAVLPAEGFNASKSFASDWIP
ncbi:hypothetical protein MTO96_046946 [Rhipicephalus appendiculatus]